MAEIVKELTLEVYSANRIKAIIAKQYDYKSRFLLIRLTDSGEDISVEPSSVVTVNAFRPNGESAAFLGSAESDGRVLVPLSYWMLELEGTVKCDVSIVDTEGRKLSSTNFQIEVERANYSGDDIEQDEHYDLLVELLEEVAQAQEAENARVAAESARVTAENGRVSAETARDTAETARASAESARDTAEGARSSAETARGTAETARASAETTRQANEASRVSAEAARAAAETAREEAEEEREHALDDYAKKDGYYEGLTAGLSENLTPYSEDSGTTQTQPFFLEGTATGNGESRVDAKQVPAYAFLQEKRGNMVCVNQLVQNNDITATYTNPAASDNYAVILGRTISMVVKHTYLISAILDANCNNIRIRNTVTGYVGTSYTGSFVFTAPVTSNAYTIQGYLNASSTSTRTLHISDLTQWFNGNIPAYLLSHLETFGRYYKGSLAYEPGRLEPATGRYLTSVGRNIWDEEWELVSDIVQSKNLIPCSSNTTYRKYVGSNSGIDIRYYDGDGNAISNWIWISTEYNTFTTPQNAQAFKFRLTASYGTTYNHDITISLYYPGESGYDQHYPHKVLSTIDTGTEQLGAFDYKIPSGLITRKTGSVDLGTLKFNLNAGTYPAHSFYSSSVSDIKSDSMLLCGDTTIISRGDYKLGLYTTGTAIIVVTKVNYNSEQELKDALSGIIVHYELAIPTTEQGTPFQETVPIDDFGQLSWSNTDVPQGNQIFYPVDYKAAIDTLINYMDGDITGLAKRGSLTATDPQTLKALIDYVNGKIPAAPTTDGTYDLVCTVTNGTPTYSWVART